MTKQKKKKSSTPEDHFKQRVTKTLIKNLHKPAPKAKKKDKKKDKPKKWRLNEKPVTERLTAKQFMKCIDPNGRFQAVIAVPFKEYSNLMKGKKPNDDDPIIIEDRMIPASAAGEHLNDMYFELFDASRKKQLVYVIVNADPKEILDALSPPAPMPAEEFPEGIVSRSTGGDGDEGPVMNRDANGRLVEASVKLTNQDDSEAIRFCAMPFLRNGDPEAIMKIAAQNWKTEADDVGDTVDDILDRCIDDNSLRQDADRASGDNENFLQVTFDAVRAKAWLKLNRREVYDEIHAK
jgi:hypothetical protein